jgi:hypothetical protein
MELSSGGLLAGLHLRAQPGDRHLDYVTWFQYWGGSMPRATPCGVPVLMMSPGSRTMNWLRYQTMWAAENTIWEVLDRSDHSVGCLHEHHRLGGCLCTRLPGVVLIIEPDAGGRRVDRWEVVVPAGQGQLETVDTAFGPEPPVEVADQVTHVNGFLSTDDRGPLPTRGPHPEEFHGLTSYCEARALTWAVGVQSKSSKGKQGGRFW